MSVVNNVKARAITVEAFEEFLASGKTVTYGKAKKRCPKYLKYNAFSANGKNDAPTFNPMKHAV